MRTQFFKLSLIAIAVAASFVSCSQDEESVETAQGNNVLVVSAQVQDFISDAATRVADEAYGNGGYITRFEAGDKIGIYVIDENGEFMCKNMPMTCMADGTWTADNNQKLYFYKNAAYIAYSPYNEDLSGQSITFAEDIKTYFTNHVLGMEGKTYADCDLMTAFVTTDEDWTTPVITFDFSHAMSMVEFRIPVQQKYITSKGYEYYGPMLVSDIVLKQAVGDNTATVINATKLSGSVFRSLLAPSEEAMTFSGEFKTNATTPVYFSTSADKKFIPVAGKFKKITVTYEGSPSEEVQKRDIAVGDYYYADGSIVPGDNEKVPAEKCIGIVYSTDMEGSDTGKENGYVIALQYAAPVVNNSAKEQFWWNGDNNVTGIISRFDDQAIEAEYDFDAMLADMNGYTVKTKLEALGEETFKKFEACYYGAYPQVEIPANTSGWYLPTLGQLTLAFRNLTEKATGSTLTDATTGNMVGTDVTTLASLVGLFTKAGGKDFMYGSTYCIWTCTDKSDSNAWTLKSNNGRIEASALAKVNQKSRQMYIFPVFSF